MGCVILRNSWKDVDQFPGEPRMNPPRSEVVMAVGTSGTGMAVLGMEKRSFWCWMREI